MSATEFFFLCLAVCSSLLIPIVVAEFAFRARDKKFRERVNSYSNNVDAFRGCDD